MITIIDYGAGNLRSVENTLDALGATYEITREPARVLSSEKLILPGVGHFGQMMRALDQLALRAPILRVAGRGTPFLGICLGLQAMFEASEEAPEERGFGLFPGRVVRFAPGVRVPQMGWNEIAARADSRLLAGLGPKPYVYFANSYYAPPMSATAATCYYTLDFTAALERENVFGVQFHPEKSGPIGMKIVRNFVEL
ncbi:MAG: imidazole glycerol phosphate synthase subunit HisH [Bryobacter sp.]|jgi:imidazole glycerol phosphate synthase glutamine amidotransferase subunit|nr:imidazole glycerol phosphate synthase subunit HisH [Bryobacter sp.]